MDELFGEQTLKSEHTFLRPHDSSSIQSPTSSKGENLLKVLEGQLEKLGSDQCEIHKQLSILSCFQDGEDKDLVTTWTLCWKGRPWWNEDTDS